jgi:hypothetical protein
MFDFFSGENMGSGGEDTGGGGGGGGGVDLSGIDFENSPIDIASILSSNSGVDLGSSLDTGHRDIYSSLFGEAPNFGSLDAGPGSFNISSFLNNDSQLLTPGGVDESFLGNLSPSERERYLATQADGYTAPTYGNQNSGVSKEMMDEFNKNYNPENGFSSQWQTSGSDRIMVNDDGTGIGLNTETGDTYDLSKEQVDKMVANNQIDNKSSGYVGATGGKGYIPGGGKTIDNPDGTKTVITTDGKVLSVAPDGKITNTGKVVDVNNPKIETDPAKVVKDAVVDPNAKITKPTDKLPVKPDAKPAAKDNNMLMALLALMAMMNKGGGSSTGSGGTIPSLQANRTQLPYGNSGARPGAGGKNYFSPTTYTQRAAGGGMMNGGGGISDLGGYSDGGRLLRGPGDGVSDSIPATIGGKQPARLATGEFVVPARVVSELGNGSTEAGAQKLYAMMDRVQKARRKTKNVAADTKAHKYLPA